MFLRIESNKMLGKVGWLLIIVSSFSFCLEVRDFYLVVGHVGPFSLDQFRDGIIDPGDRD